MPRTLKPGYNPALADNVTAPLFLVELQLTQRTYRFCSFDEGINALERQWFDHNLAVQGPSQRSGGTLQSVVSVPYDVWQQGARLIDDILSERPQDRPASVWASYFHHEAYLEPVLLLDGVIDSVNIGSTGQSKPRISFTVVSKGNRGGVTPFIRVAAPLLNHITPAGSVVAFNGARYEVDR